MRTETNPVASKSRFIDIIITSFLFMTCFLVFYPVLDNYFLLDDGQWLETGKSMVEGAGGLFQWVGGAYFEPVLNFIFAVYFSLFGLQPAGYYAMNIFLHAVNAVLVYCFSLLLLPRERTAAGLAALMFVVLYAHHQPMLWIAAFVHLASTMFLLVCFILFAQYVRTRQWAYYVLSLACFVVCLMTKESTVMLPFVLLVYFILLPDNALTPIKWQRLIPFFILSSLCFSFYFLRGIPLQTKYGGYGYTLGLHFLPTFLSSWLEIFLATLGYVTFSGKPEGEKTFVVNAGLLLLLLFFSAWSTGKEKERDKAAGRCIALGVLFFFVTLLPFSFFQQLMGYGSFHRYRYFYLPSVGFCLSFGHFLSFVLGRIMREKKLQWSALVFIGVLMNIVLSNVRYVQKAERYYSMYGRMSKNMVGQIGGFIAHRKPTGLYLLDFPETPVMAVSKHHIMSLVRLKYGEEWKIFMMRDNELHKFAPDKNVYLVYRNGTVHRYEKKK